MMYGANLSYKLLLQYLDEILKAGLLLREGKSSYWITDRGKKFLEIYEDYERTRKKLDEHVKSLEIGEDALREMLIS